MVEVQSLDCMRKVSLEDNNRLTERRQLMLAKFVHQQRSGRY